MFYFRLPVSKAASLQPHTAAAGRLILPVSQKAANRSGRVCSGPGFAVQQQAVADGEIRTGFRSF